MILAWLILGDQKMSAYYPNYFPEAEIIFQKYSYSGIPGEQLVRLVGVDFLIFCVRSVGVSLSRNLTFKMANVHFQWSYSGT